ncbi:MAG: HNH endonuclease [Ruminococcus sp.]|nr:HNH endonuclease [Ruminococcus sp.]
MYRRRKRIEKLISLVLSVLIMLMSVGCSNTAPDATVSSPNDEVITESTEKETVVTEKVIEEDKIVEHITEEVYLNEIVEVESKVTELLLEEETISEVLVCKTIYVPQDNIEEFSKNSQTASLFGDGIDLSAVLTKLSVGTGVILTLAIMKKVGFSNPIASIVTAAADKSLKFAASGSLVGSLFGGMFGVTDSIDESGRSTAILSFATSTALLIISIVAMVVTYPSGGWGSAIVAEKIKFVLAAISAGTALGSEITSTYKMIKKIIDTDCFDINWNNVNWEKLGVPSIQKAIDGGSSGYMWGAFVGAVYGGMEGYEFYHKYNAPYSTLKARIDQTPKNDEFGHWEGKRGESVYIYDKSKTIRIGNETYEIKPGTKVTYKNGIPDFSPYAKAEVKIEMTKDRYPKKKDGIVGNFEKADKALAEHWTKTKFEGKSWTAREIEQYRAANNLTWHEMNNMESVQLVPKEVNGGFGHLGGIGECNLAMQGKEGVLEFD